MKGPDLDEIEQKLPLPQPGAPLPALLPEDILTLGAGTAMGRIFCRGGPYPTGWDAFRSFGPTGSRFDPHLADASGAPCEGSRGVMYLAYRGRRDALTTCLAEFFQRAEMIDRRGKDPWFASFDLARPVRLLDLHGLWTSRAGISTAIASGPKYRSQHWAREIYAQYPDLDGIAYPSSMAGHGEAVALFERATDALPANPEFHRALADPVLHAAITRSAELLGKGLDG